MQNSALRIDQVVVMVVGWHPWIRRLLRPILYPFIYWRLKGVAQTLANDCRWLPAVTWDTVEKHGENVVYYRRERFNPLTRKYEEEGMMVVDYKHHTVRTVIDLPNEYKVTGRTF